MARKQIGPARHAEWDENHPLMSDKYNYIDGYIIPKSFKGTADQWMELPIRKRMEMKKEAEGIMLGFNDMTPMTTEQKKAFARVTSDKLESYDQSSRPDTTGYNLIGDDESSLGLPRGPLNEGTVMHEAGGHGINGILERLGSGDLQNIWGMVPEREFQYSTGKHYVDKEYPAGVFDRIGKKVLGHYPDYDRAVLSEGSSNSADLRSNDPVISREQNPGYTEALEAQYEKYPWMRDALAKIQATDPWRYT